jgi:tRNA-splicing ligase RtcB (3'-phosphate/5'-hydroxy nucleic acid ligase)
MADVLYFKEIELRKTREATYEIPKTGAMRVPGRVYQTEKMLREDELIAEVLRQVRNVAHLPGAVGASVAMADMHWGYGFPIGGVAATDAKTGAISPGGVGYDINCGVRLASIAPDAGDLEGKLDKLADDLFNAVPSGVGSSGATAKMGAKELRRVAEQGAAWAVERGYGTEADLDRVEERGVLREADFDAVSKRAIERGGGQVGTLGSGNHFLELGVVERVRDREAAEAFGLREGGVTVMIHSGSRGFGHQVCDDYLKRIARESKRFGYDLPDRQLACAPLDDPVGEDYYAAMCCAANYAWANRQTMTGIVRETTRRSLGVSDRDLGFRLVYDVCHNIAKIETHEIDGERRRVCVHRKGATRAFPAGDPNIPSAYRGVGQPVLVPGDMGRPSFVCVGTERAMAETFGSSCHGAGRRKSRSKAKQAARGRDLVAELRERGVTARASSKGTLAEEASEAYKDGREVVEATAAAGLLRVVAELRPIVVVKG